MPLHDPLDSVLARLRVHTHLFHSGTLQGTTRFQPRNGQGALHILRQGNLRAAVPRRDTTPAEFAISAPSVVFFPHPTPHALAASDTSDGAVVTSAAVALEGDAALPLARSLPAVVVAPLDQMAGAQPALGALFAEVDDPHTARPALIDRLLDAIPVHTLRWMLTHPGRLPAPRGMLAGLSDDRLARAMTAIHEAPGEPWTVRSLARIARMPRCAFASRFQDTVGSTPLEYLSQWRLAVS